MAATHRRYGCTRSRRPATAASRSPGPPAAAPAHPSPSTPARPSPWPPWSATCRPPAPSPSACAPARTAGRGARGSRPRSRSWTRTASPRPSSIPSGPAPVASYRSRADRSTGRGPCSPRGRAARRHRPHEDSGLVASVTGAARRFAAAVVGVSLTDTASAAATTPVIVTRAEWGADESLRSGSPSYAPVKVAFVHHTASGNVYAQADAPGIVRAIYAYHTKTLHWSDIGYNFLIDRYGTIYEGRYGGIARGVIGAQVGGFNTGSTGVSVLGTFIDEAPPAETVAALERLLAWKLAVHGLDPAGTSTLTCGADGQVRERRAVTFPVIAGHRQANSTECPATPSTRSCRRSAPTSPSASAPSLVATLSASDASSARTATVCSTRPGSTSASRPPPDWRLAVRDAGGRTVALLERRRRLGVRHVGRHHPAAAPSPDGVYTAELTATAADGGTAGASAPVTVDTAAPRLSGSLVPPRHVQPQRRRPDGDRRRLLQPAETCSVRVGILDATATSGAGSTAGATRETAPYTVTWDGRITAGDGLTAAPDGIYRFDVERRDAAGNIARQGIGVTLDRTLGCPARRPRDALPQRRRVARRDDDRLHARAQATVTVAIRVGDTVVRTLQLGDLGAGARSVAWDGRAGVGRVPRQLAADVHRHGDLDARREQRAQGSSSTCTAEGVRAAAARRPRSAPARASASRSSTRSAPRPTCSYVVTDAKGRRVAIRPPRLAADGQPLQHLLDAGGARCVHGDVPRGRPGRQPRGQPGAHRRHRSLTASAASRRPESIARLDGAQASVDLGHERLAVDRRPHVPLVRRPIGQLQVLVRDVLVRDLLRAGGGSCSAAHAACRRR